jgi:hypothetical protein
MRYLILASHPPEMCPLTNAKVREHVLRLVPEWEKIANNLGINFVTRPLVNDEHMVVCLLESPKAELLTEFINESGMQQWNTVKLIPSTPIEDAIRRYDEIKPIL